MGFVNGKTDADLLIEEDNAIEDEERVFVLKVSCNKIPHSAWLTVPPAIVILRRSKRGHSEAQHLASRVCRATEENEGLSDGSERADRRSTLYSSAEELVQT